MATPFEAAMISTLKALRNADERAERLLLEWWHAEQVRFAAVALHADATGDRQKIRSAKKTLRQAERAYLSVKRNTLEPLDFAGENMMPTEDSDAHCRGF